MKMNGTSRRLIEHVRITSDFFLPPTAPFNRAKGFDDGVMCGGSCAACTGRACLRLEAKDSTGSTMNHVPICLLVQNCRLLVPAVGLFDLSLFDDFFAP